MTRPNGGWRCSYGQWHDLYETCKCWETTAAVMASAFPHHPMVGAGHMPAVACPDDCEHRVWPLTPAQHAEEFVVYRRLEVERGAT